MIPDDHLVFTGALIVLIGTGVMAGSIGVAAAEDDSFTDVVIDSLGDENDGLIPDPIESYAAGLTNRFLSEPADTTAADAEDDVQALANDHSSEFVAYADGANYTVNDASDTIRVVYEIDGESASHVVETTHDNGSLTGLSVVESTGRTVDVECTLPGDFARNAPSELDTFYTEYVTANDTNAAPFIARLAGQYGADNPCEVV